MRAALPRALAAFHRYIITRYIRADGSESVQHQDFPQNRTTTGLTLHYVYTGGDCYVTWYRTTMYQK